MTPWPAVWMRGAARLRAAATTASRSAAASAVAHSTDVDWNGDADCAALLRGHTPVSRAIGQGRTSHHAAQCSEANHA